MSDASVLQARLVGALFVERGLLTDEQLEQALARQAESGELLGEILVNEFEISRIELASVLAEQWAALEQQEPGTSGSRAAKADANGTAATRKRIGEIFVERGFVSETELDEALELQKTSGQPLGEVLIQRGSLSRLDLAGALAEQWAGLEKLRPPAPKKVEGWQQVAPVEHAAAAAQGATRLTESDADEAELAPEPGVADAVTVLSERLDFLESRGAGDPGAGVDELRGAVTDLTARLDALTAGDATGTDAATDQLEAVRSALETVSERLAVIEQRETEHPWRDELEHVASGLAMRVDGLNARVDDAAAEAQSGLEAVLETLAELQLRTAGPAEEKGDADLAALAERLDGVVAASKAVDELSGRLAALEQRDAAPAWRDEIRALQQRLAELAATAADETLEHRIASIEARAGETPWRDEVAALQTELQELATAPSPADALAGRVDALESLTGATPWRDEVAALQRRLDELSAEAPDATSLTERVAALESAGQERPWREELRRLSEEVTGRLDKLGEVETTGRVELEQLRSSLAGLDGRLQRADGLADRVSALEARDAETPWRDEVASLQRRLDELAASGTAADTLAERVAALEAGGQERPWRKELRQLSEELGGRLEGLTELGSVGQQQLEDVRGEVAALARRLADLPDALAPVDHAHEEIAVLQARLAELAALPSLVDGLAHRLGEAEQRGAETPWHEDVTRLAARVAQLGAGLEQAVTDDAVAPLRDGLSALQQALAASETGAASQLAELSKRLDEVARTTAELAASGVAGASGVDRTELEHLEVLVNDIRSASRQAGHAAEAAHLHADERAAAEATARDQLAAELRTRLDALAASVADSVQQREAQAGSLAAEIAAVRREALGREDVDRALAAGEERLIERLAAYDEAIVVLRRRLEEIAALDGVLGERLGGVEAAVVARLDEAGAALAAETASWREAHASLSERIDEAERHSRSTPQALHALRTQFESLVTRLDAAEKSVVAAGRAASGWTDAASALGSRLVAVEEATASRDDTVVPRLEAIEHRLEAAATEAGERARAGDKALRKGLGSLAERLDAVEGALAAPVEDTVTPRLEELEERLRAEAAKAAERVRGAEQDIRDGLAGVIERLDAVEALAAPGEDTVTPRLEELERRLQAESAAAADRARSAQKDARQSLADVAARLTAVEEDLAAPDGDDVAPRLEELERRLDREVSQADERTRATELALRDGLGTLAARLADSETAYAEAGEGLRRSIERLGRAIVETDDRIATRDEPAAAPVTDGYVAFAPTPEGYRLVAVAGPAPGIGLTVELDGYGEPLCVTRIGASPIPLDERPCVYLDRA